MDKSQAQQRDNSGQTVCRECRRKNKLDLGSYLAHTAVSMTALHWTSQICQTDKIAMGFLYLTPFLVCFKQKATKKNIHFIIIFLTNGSLFFTRRTIFTDSSSKSSSSSSGSGGSTGSKFFWATVSWADNTACTKQQMFGLGEGRRKTPASRRIMCPRGVVKGRQRVRVKAKRWKNEKRNKLHQWNDDHLLTLPKCQQLSIESFHESLTPLRP